jgi:hypothetical protein
MPAPTTRADAVRRIWDHKRWSTGPFLQIHPDNVGPNRNRAVLGYIESVMLFPDNELKRDRAIAATAAETIIELISETTVVGKEVAEVLRKAPEIPALDDELKRRFSIGVAVGKVVVEMICDSSATLDVLFSKAQNEFNKARHNLSIETPTIQNVQKNWWPRFRSVAHLWAASVMLPERFPCSLDNVPQFLATAEYVRYLAQRRELVRQDDAKLLEFGTALAVPTAVPLPFPPIAIEGHREPWQPPGLNDTTSK